MAAPIGPGLPDTRISLFEHAARLHAEHPTGPLPKSGEPYPDAHAHRGDRPRSPKDYRAVGIEAAAVLDAHFTRPGTQPRELEDAFHEIFVPIHRNEHIIAAAWRADAQRVRETGRWLVQHSRDRCSAIIGLALLADGLDEEDIPFIQTIGLLSDQFSPLAAHALGRRRRGGADALMWLGDRAAGWGRVYLAEALCRRGGPEVRAWLLRRSCNGDYLDGYYAGLVATQAHLHEAITASPDEDLIDHGSLILIAMSRCGGMGVTLAGYPPALAVLEAHAGHAHRLAPTVRRFFRLGLLASYLSGPKAASLPWEPGQRDRVLASYISLLDRDDWCAVAREGLAAKAHGMSWLSGDRSLPLRAFTSKDRTG